MVAARAGPAALCGAVVVLLGLACMPAARADPADGAPGAADDPSVLRVAVGAPLATLDPLLSTAHLVRDHGYMVYDTLFAVDDTLTPRHQMLALHTVSEDGLVYRFMLRDGLRFHDGAPVRAADAVASIRRWGALDRLGRELMAATESLSATSETTFELRLARPYGRVVESLSAPGAHVPFVMPARLIGDDPTTPVREVVGSGPFRFAAEDRIPGSVVVYERFADYVPRDEPPRFLAGGKVVLVDRVEWHVFRDSDLAVQAMAQGEIDYWPTPPRAALPALVAVPGVVLDLVDPLGRQGWIRPNQRRAPFDTVAGRQALDQVVRAAGIGAESGVEPAAWSDCRAMFGCGTPMESRPGTPSGGDVEAARRLFSAAGYDGEPVIVLDPVDVPVLHAAAGAVAGTLTRAGISVAVETTDWTGLAARRKGEDWDLFPTMWSVIDIAEPGRHPGLGSAGEAELAGGVEAPALSEGVSALLAAPDPGRRLRLAAALQRAADARGPPYVIFGQWREPAAYRTTVRDVPRSPVPVFWTIRKER